MTSPQRPTLPLLAALALILVLVVSPGASTKVEAKQRAVGRVEPDDLRDKEVQKVVNFAVKTYNDMVNDLYVSRPIHVMSASKQEVDGKNFYIKIEFGQTTCTKAQSDLADCPFNEQPQQQKRVTCNFEINTVAKLDKMSVTNFNCYRA
ncbi:hypothetical protein STEG23_021590 [Scotinomys teguina]